MIHATRLQALSSVAQATFPEVNPQTGFGADLDAFLATAPTGDIAVFISVSLCSPKRAREGGRRPGYDDSFTLYLRGRSNPSDPEANYYALFVPLRDNLDGYQFQIGDEIHTIQFEPSGPMYEQGFDVFALNVSIS